MERITIEVWDTQTGCWFVLTDDVANLTQALRATEAFVITDDVERTYRTVVTRVDSITEGGRQLSPTERDEHRGYQL